MKMVKLMKLDQVNQQQQQQLNHKDKVSIIIKKKKKNSILIFIFFFIYLDTQQPPQSTTSSQRSRFNQPPDQPTLNRYSSHPNPTFRQSSWNNDRDTGKYL